ncbi:aldo/keto reductase [Microbacteriaceae bacterium VKM Ac-2855]|nr:aldo/keto reductase [Microbacteriaceae bacterium VKM Ac-2855]
MPKLRTGAFLRTGSLAIVPAVEHPSGPVPDLAPIATVPRDLAVRRGLGDSPHSVFPVSLGAAALGTRADAPQSVEVLDRYTAWGGNVVVTSQAYAGGRGEEILGQWMIARRNRDAMVVVSRIGPSAEHGSTPRALVRSVEEALARLRTDRLDVLALYPNSTIRLDEMLSAADVLITAGKIRAVAASGFSAEALFEARVLAAHGLPRFCAAEVRYNLLERHHAEGDVSLVAAGQGLALVPTVPLAHGFLAGIVRSRRAARSTARGSLAAEHLGRRGLRMLGAIDGIAAEIDAHPAAVAVAWLLGRPHVATTAVNLASPDEVDAVVRAAAIRLEPEHAVALERAHR